MPSKGNKATTKHGRRSKKKRSRVPDASAGEFRAPEADTPPIQCPRRERALGSRDLNFHVSEKFHRRFKVTAAKWRMSMKSLLEAMFDEWITKHGAEPPLIAHERRFDGSEVRPPGRDG